LLTCSEPVRSLLQTSLELAPNQFRTGSEQASVMAFGFYSVGQMGLQKIAVGKIAELTAPY